MKPSPLMGEAGWGVNVNDERCVSGGSTPPHEQVRIAPRSEAMPGRHGDLFILPIKGRGYLPVKSGLRFSMNAATPS
jgi:hypothetical protein